LKGFSDRASFSQENKTISLLKKHQPFLDNGDLNSVYNLRYFICDFLTLNVI